MTASLFIDTTTDAVRSAITGTAQPVIVAVLQRQLSIEVSFFAGDGAAAALLAGSPTFRVALKPISTPSGAVLALLSSPTATGSTSYIFAWSSLDSTLLRTTLGDAESAQAMLEIEWTIAGVVQKAQLEVTIINAWLRTADTAPDFLQFATTITALGYMRFVTSDGTVYHLGLNTGEPPSS